MYKNEIKVYPVAYCKWLTYYILMNFIAPGVSLYFLSPGIFTISFNKKLLKRVPSWRSVSTLISLLAWSLINNFTQFIQKTYLYHLLLSLNHRCPYHFLKASFVKNVLKNSLHQDMLTNKHSERGFLYSNKTHNAM